MSIKIKILTKILEKSNNKLNIFANKNILNKFNFNISELCDLISTFLGDDQIVKLFEFEHFINLPPINKQYIFDLVKDDNLKLDLLKNFEFLSNMDLFLVDEMIKSLGEYGKVQILHDTDFLTKYEIDSNNSMKIMISLSDTTKVELLSNKDLIENQLKLNKYKISSIIEGIQDEKLKLQAIDICNLENNQIVSVLEICSNNSKELYLLDKKYNFNKDNAVSLLSSMDVDSLITFINNHNNFLFENNLSPYEITIKFDKEKQLEFVEKLENVNLPTNEKRKILATLRQEAKDNIDISNYLEEYKTAIEMKVNELDMIVPDLDGDLEQYHDLEDLMYINPIDMTEEDKEKLPRLFELFPHLKISNYICNTSTFEEFKNGEKWIKSVIQ